jgi:hypothetical protein
MASPRPIKSPFLQSACVKRQRRRPEWRRIGGAIVGRGRHSAERHRLADRNVHVSAIPEKVLGSGRRTSIFMKAHADPVDTHHRYTSLRYLTIARPVDDGGEGGILVRVTLPRRMQGGNPSPCSSACMQIGHLSTGRAERRSISAGACMPTWVISAGWQSGWAGLAWCSRLDPEPALVIAGAATFVFAIDRV